MLADALVWSLREQRSPTQLALDVPTDLTRLLRANYSYRSRDIPQVCDTPRHAMASITRPDALAGLGALSQRGLYQHETSTRSYLDERWRCLRRFPPTGSLRLTIRQR